MHLSLFAAIDLATPSREIMWNVSHPLNTIFMYASFAVALLIGTAGIYSHIEAWLSGQGQNYESLPWWKKLSYLIRYGAFQKKVVREKRAAVAHTLVYTGFLVLLFTTTMVLIDHDLGIKIYRGQFYLAVTILSDIFGLLLIAGCLHFAKRRYQNLEDLLHSRPADALLLFSLVLLCLQGYLLEGLRIHATEDPWAKYSPVGYVVAQLFWGISKQATQWIHFITWWFHALTVFACVAVAPYTKLFHIIASPLNLMLQSRTRPAGALQSPGDIMQRIEAGEEFNLGISTIKDYSPKQLLDLDACTSCGRCQDACPAYNTGKPLSPKWLILDTRNHMLGLQAKGALTTKSLLPTALKKLDATLMDSLLLQSSGLEKTADGYRYEQDGVFRAQNKLVQKSVGTLAKSLDQKICGDLIEENVFWSCTTCMACVEACPVGIQHVDQIVENRRNQVMVEGKIPEEAGRTLKALEARSNPYGAQEDRIKWLGDLSVRILKPGDEVDYLYWVGCVSAYDSRKQKIARALTQLMQKADLSFGILGTAEGCTGDPARRLGDENLFQTLAKTNIELLKSLKFKTLVANCPHCFNTIKNEYPQFGNLGEGKQPEIIHHSVLLRRLLDEGKLILQDGSNQKVTFHDPCYLGRYNKEFEAPRETMRRVKGLKIIEMEQSKEKGLCCGAGGGHFWMDLKIGERVNVKRTDQAAITGAETVATACPFCMQMMEDGVKLTDRESSLQVKDIAEVLAERI